MDCDAGPTPSHKKLIRNIILLLLISGSALVLSRIWVGPSLAEMELIVHEEVCILRVKGGLKQADQRKFRRLLNKAESESDELIIILDSPGGSVQAGYKMGHHLAESPLNCTVLIHNAHGSALWMASVAEERYLLKDASIGGVHIILDVGGPAGPSKEMVTDMENYIRTLTLSLAPHSSVEEPLFLALMLPSERFERGGRLWSEAGHPLILTASESVELGYAAGVFESEEEFLEALRVPFKNP